MQIAPEGGSLAMPHQTHHDCRGTDGDHANIRCAGKFLSELTAVAE